MQYAIIDERGIYRGLVDAIAATPPDVGYYAPQGVRISVLGCPPTDEAGKWRDDGTAWLAVTVADAGLARLAEINAGYETVMAYVQAGYPDKEVLSWERQASQARELQTDPQAEALFVRALAATKGVNVEEMARRILANAESWEPIAAMLTAQRQLMEEAVWAAQSVEEIEAVKVSYTV